MRARAYIPLTGIEPRNGATQMTTLAINKATFTANAEQPAHGFWIEGTVEVTLQGKTERLPATKGLTERNMGEITARGLVARYETGAKVWPARLETVVAPRTNQPWERLSFGFDSRSGKHKKAGWVGFASAAAPARVSKR